ncbi:MAG TPA: hypothetical protein DCL15_09225, partial [Chloroflexi bacterium]|nr:hypothetical protein [Chloroflexota bacterium]
GRLHELLLPTGDRLPLPDYRFDADILQRLRHGQTVILPDAACEPSRQLAAARDENGVLVGVIRRLGVAREGAGWRWRAQKWLQ